MTGSNHLRDRLAWSDDNTLRLDDILFDVRALGASVHDDRLRLMKDRAMVERYVDLLAALQPQLIVELGIFQGGSAAFLSALLRPERYVAVDIGERRIVVLDEFLEQYGLEDSVRLHYGTDQADAVALERIVQEDLDGRAPDLIIDDASHFLEPTRASFNTLFPRLRPGGTYIIEDWAWGHFPFSRPPMDKSLSVLVYELLLSLPYAQDVITEVSVNKYWAEIRKSDSGQPTAPWDIRQAYSPYGHRIVDAAEAASDPAAT
jgi:predicted O-methyltransferase YrrM